MSRENLAPGSLCGETIMLEVGVNGEADLQIFHTWIIANYQIIQETSMQPALLPAPSHPHLINTHVERNNRPTRETRSKTLRSRRLQEEGANPPMPQPHHHHPQFSSHGPHPFSPPQVAFQPQSWPALTLNSSLAPSVPYVTRKAPFLADTSMMPTGNEYNFPQT